jgi:diguanylate cyclase (GGDEF)-like protein
VQRAGVSGRPLSVLLIDIDYFRTFNERYGRAYGDHILYSLAHTLASHFRPTETIVRYGGDAFLVLLPDTGEEAARRIGDRVQPVVMEAVPALPDGRTVPIPPSRSVWPCSSPVRPAGAAGERPGPWPGPSTAAATAAPE